MLKQKFILNTYHYEVEVKAMCKLLFVPHWILTQSKQYQSKTTYYLLHIFIWIVAVITWIVTQKKTYLTSKCILNEKLAVYFLNLISFAIYFAIKKNTFEYFKCRKTEGPLREGEYLPSSSLYKPTMTE